MKPIKSVVIMGMAAALTCVVAPLDDAGAVRARSTRAQAEHAEAGNAVATIQDGDNNSIRVDQAGHNNFAGVIQQGNNNRACVVQRGNNQATIVDQVGNGANTMVVDWGDFHGVGEGKVRMRRIMFRC